MTPEPKLKIEGIDNGYCRILYRYNGAQLFCLQEECEGVFEFYVCTDDEEPLGPHGVDRRKLPIPEGDSTIERNAREYLQRLHREGAQQ